MRYRVDRRSGYCVSGKTCLIALLLATQRNPALRGVGFVPARPASGKVTVGARRRTFGSGHSELSNKLCVVVENEIVLENADARDSISDGFHPALLPHAL